MTPAEVQFQITPGAPLRGALRVPGDKSISHRALLIGALAEGETRVTGFLDGADCLATAACLRELGVEIAALDGELRIAGVGLNGLREARSPLDCGNAGTAMRLLAGVLAGQPFASELTGDASLSRRPMQRIIEPLARMGADIESESGHPPLRISGRRPLAGIDYSLPVASAQVASAILLAGLYADAPVQVREPAVCRDHTERMLAAFGAAISRPEPRCLRLEPGPALRSGAVRVPADLSSAAFFLCAAAAMPGAELVLNDVGVNPSRTGVLDILAGMGARLRLENRRDWSGEPVADIHVTGTELAGFDIPPELVPLAIDEFPALLATAALARGTTRLRGAAELRVKESDRIAGVARGLRALGIAVDETADGMTVTGGRLQGGVVDSHGDHRLAMAFAVVAQAAAGPVTIRHCRNVDTSFPGFVEQARAVGLAIDAEVMESN